MKGIIRMGYREDLEYAYQENSKLKLENDELKKKVDKYEVTYWLFKLIQSLKKIKFKRPLFRRIKEKCKTAVCDSDGQLRVWTFIVLFLVVIAALTMIIAVPVMYFDGKHPTNQECAEHLREANCKATKAKPIRDKCICISDGYVSEVSW